MMRLHRGLAALGAVAIALAIVTIVALVSTSSSDNLETSFANEENQGGAVELLDTLQDVERADATFAGCLNSLKGEGMELVMRVDSACGDVFTASQCPLQCHTAALALGDAMGCCWPTLIKGFSQVQPTAAHSWHSWSFNLENLCGVSLAGRCDAKTYDQEKSVADSALDVAQNLLEKARAEEAAASSAREAAEDAQNEAKKIQAEMQSEEEEFEKMRKHFRLSRADAARAVLVERMVHNSVKKDLQKAWGIHQQVDHDSHLATKIAAGTQVQQANARALLKSAHAAKKSVYAMAKMARVAKKAAFKLHKLAMKDLSRAEKTAKKARLQRDIAKKAGKDVAKQLKMSEKIIARSKKEQKDAKKLWGALEAEEKGFNAEHKEAADGVDEEEAIDKKMQAEIGAAQDEFEKFSKEAEGVESSVSHAEDLAEHAATISAESENLLEQTKQQQDEIDKERGWLMQQEAQVLSGKKGIATIEGQMDVLKRKYYHLRKAFAGLEYVANHFPLHNAPARRGLVYYHYHREGYTAPGTPLTHVTLPFPPRTHVILHHEEQGVGLGGDVNVENSPYSLENGNNNNNFEEYQ